MNATLIQIKEIALEVKDAAKKTISKNEGYKVKDAVELRLALRYIEYRMERILEILQGEGLA